MMIKRSTFGGTVIDMRYLLFLLCLSFSIHVLCIMYLLTSQWRCNTENSSSFYVCISIIGLCIVINDACRGKKMRGLR
ncbi:hypothetical protein F5890DRAFT_1496177 [Lentinula detonsa]|uniref:Uncharacterized protein n=1 Tax=Lentinula detonsa TaxID=2804962 RepID=A0AA38UWP9_9AGAR|nr:hypothetical protein F5890DRAFT_1496177 [Lentinula detonsa]